MNDIILKTILKAIVIYFLALVLTKFVGRKIITKMNFFDFVMGVSMGAMITNAAIDKEARFISAVTTLIVFTILAIAIDYISTKNFLVRKIINYEPVIVIENGIIIDKNLKKLRITVNELMMKLREKDKFSLDEVEFAIMEGDGQMSVLAKADKKAVTPYDMKVKVRSSGLLKDIIIDGKIIENNLKVAEINKEWLENELKEHKIKNISEVFYAGIDSNKKLNISKKYPSDYKVDKKYGIEE